MRQPTAPRSKFTGFPPTQRQHNAAAKGMPSGSEGSSPKGVRATRPAAPERTEASAGTLKRKFPKRTGARTGASATPPERKFSKKETAPVWGVARRYACCPSGSGRYFNWLEAMSQMSTEAVQAVLERTVTDPSFRTRLFSQPDAALAEYELTP